MVFERHRKNTSSASILHHSGQTLNSIDQVKNNFEQYCSEYCFLLNRMSCENCFESRKRVSWIKLFQNTKNLKKKENRPVFRTVFLWWRRGFQIRFERHIKRAAVFGGAVVGFVGFGGVAEIVVYFQPIIGQNHFSDHGVDDELRFLFR